MALTNTKDTYGGVAKSLHWIIAVLVIVMLLFGLVMEEFEKPLRSLLVQIHKSTGVTILALMLLRLLWRWVSPPPALPNNIPRWQAISAHWSHALFYICLILIPLSGILMSMAGGHSITVWWLFKLNLPIPKDKMLKAVGSNMHEILAWAITGLIAIHVLAALKHHLIEKNNVLWRMLK